MQKFYIENGNSLTEKEFKKFSFFQEDPELKPWRPEHKDAKQTFRRREFNAEDSLSMKEGKSSPNNNFIGNSKYKMQHMHNLPFAMEKSNATSALINQTFSLIDRRSSQYAHPKLGTTTTYFHTDKLL